MATPIQLPVPTGCPWNLWASRVVEELGYFDLPMVPESRWQDFAREFIKHPSFDGQGAPDPQKWHRWQDWAAALLDFPISV